MIEYGIISESIDFYTQHGFSRIESPWTVTKEVSEITKPLGAREFQLVHDNNKVLVASGEQSFLYLYLKEFLPKGRFQTTTPCFRFENFDTFHTKYFMKNELIITNSECEANLNGDLNAIIAHAKTFFMQYFPSEGLKVKRTNPALTLPSYDIEYNGIELGSYGIRKCDYLTWIYGTGVAEPRMSQTLRKYGLSLKGN